MGWGSIHVKVVVLQSALVATVLAAFSVAVHHRMAATLAETLDTAIGCQLDYACFVIRSGGHRCPDDLGEDIATHPALPADSRIVRILSPGGYDWYLSPQAQAYRDDLARATHPERGGEQPLFESVEVGRSVLRVATARVVTHGRLAAIVQVGTSTDRLQQALARLRALLVFASLAALLTAALGGWWLSQVALRPVAEMTSMACRIGVENLTARVPVPATGDQLERLGNTFNGMLARIEAAVAQIHRFTADASHQLRAPLTTIRAEAQVALRRARSRDQLRAALQGVLAETEYMSRTIEGLLTLARADAGEVTLDLKPTSLRAVAEQVVERRKPLADGAVCSLLLAPNPDAVVQADAQYLLQLVDDLVDNALHHTSEGGHVTVSIGRDDGCAILSVADDGEGIPPANLDRIFDRFFSTRGRSKNGSGLGLSICLWIARAHGGDIRVESQPDRGSTFTVRLPESGLSEIPAQPARHEQ